jgi:muramoyltetrapeptide carboxypeptidase LdcA involved in peptidoglycan recycling
MSRHILLKAGDTICICAPSGSFDSQKLKRGAVVLEEIDFAVLIPQGIFEKKDTSKEMTASGPGL